MAVLILFAFLAGVVTILSPCILPILPIVLSSSLTGGKKRPFGVVTGFILSFSFFTLALTALVKATGVSAGALRTISVVIILVFGLSILVPSLNLVWEKFASKIASKAPQSQGGNQSSGFGGGLLVGVSLGLIWTPCVGPIMAAVLTLAATSSVTLQAVFITLSYSLGTALPMLAIIYGGRKLLDKVPFLLKNTGKIQKVFGIILILVAVMIFFEYDRKFQTYILTKFPEYGVGITQLEEFDVVRDKLEDLRMPVDEEVSGDVSESGGECKSDFGPARSFEGGNNWLNSEELSLEELKGKVVLVDFWTYTCINCIRTLPFVTGWYEQYKDDGLVVLGVHTPEFEFEKDTENVVDAMEEYGINYPVVQDNDYTIWRRYENRYWPAEYFIDREGCVRRTHFGEGAYDESEEFIRMLLEEDGPELKDDMLNLKEEVRKSRTPESYLGFQRIDRFDSPEEIGRNEVVEYSLPSKLALNHLAYEGEWEVNGEFAKPMAGSALELNFEARDVFLVMRSEDEISEVKVLIDGEVISEGVGSDVEDGVVKVDVDRLYELVEFDDYEEHILRLEFLDEGMEVFAFTFG